MDKRSSHKALPLARCAQMASRVYMIAHTRLGLSCGTVLFYSGLFYRALFYNVLFYSVLLGLVACERTPQSQPPPPPAPESARTSFTQATATAQEGVPALVFLGDSLTAGYGLHRSQSFPALIAERLRKAGLPHRVVNAGVSGDTSAGGLARLDWLFRQRVDVLFVALGGNDGLRGLPPERMEENLAQIIEQGQAQGASVVLGGMLMPENYGEDYTRRFREVFPRLAQRYGLPLVPFMLEGVALDPLLNLSDGIHPNPRGAERVAQNVWQVLESVLKP